MTATMLDTYRDSVADREHLGRIVIASVRETKIRHIDLVDLLRQADLEDWAPRKPSDINVFRRISTNAGQSRIQWGDDRTYNVLVRDVANEEKEILRRLVVEAVDARGKRLDYSDAFDIIFHKPTRQVRVEARTPEAWHGPAASIARELPAEYEAWRGCVNADALRTIVNRVFDDIHAIGVRETGGCWFVPQVNAPLVDRLERFGTASPGVYIHSLPLVDETKQRDMVREALIDEASQEVDRFSAELAELLRGDDPITSKRYASYGTRFDHLTDRLDTYAALLEDNLDVSRSRLQILRAQMSRLVDRTV